MLTERQVLIYAIDHKEVVEFSYDGFVRVFRPHILGVMPDGQIKFAGWQVLSGKGGQPDWRTFSLEKLESNVRATGGHFTGPHDGFDPQFYGFAQVLAQIR